MKKTLALTLIGCAPLFGFSQQFIGYTLDNYSGVPGIIQNPASVAGNKYKVNFNIFSMSVLGGNNAYELKSERFRKFNFSDMEEGKDYLKSSNTDKKNLWLNTDILGPSLLITTSRKSGIGLYTRMRTIVNENNLSDKTFRSFGSDSGFYNTQIQEENIQLKAHAFAEAGLTYGRIIHYSAEHVLKMGITAKYVVGIAAAGLYSNKMLVNLAKTDNINELKGDLNVRYSSNLDNIDDNFDDVFNNKTGNKGWGADIGFTYEWRPETIGWLVSDPTLYKVRINAAVTDIGSVKYINSQHGNSYAVDGAGYTTDDLDKKDGETFDKYFSRLDSTGILTTQSHSDKLKVSLPTALRFDVDYHIWKRLFINVGTVVNLVNKNKNQYSAHYTTSYTITPRLEKKWISLYSPFYYNAVSKKMAWGAGFRLGGIFVGSGSVLSNIVSSKNISATDVHFGFTVPIYQRRRIKRAKAEEVVIERSQPKPQPVQEVVKQQVEEVKPQPVQPVQKPDTVETKVEVVKEVQVTHDKDNDGVTDEKDACPDVAGEVALSGCPDKDKDGIADQNDKCPDVAGTPKYNGCPVPDSDGDGLDDENDKCPAVAGKPENHGCPAIKQEIVKKVNVAAKSIYFLTGKDIIQKVSFPKLNMLVGILNSDKDMLIIIEGHTDNKGKPATNQRLSEKRAQAVKNYLVKKGIAENRITAQGFGNAKPIATNATPAGRAKNRRVELHLSY